MANCGIDNNTAFFIQPVELCTIKALQTLETNYGSIYRYNSSNIYPDLLIKEPNLNKDFRTPNTNEFIYKNNNDKTSLCSSFGNNEWNINCAIQYNNPFFTYDKDSKKCVLLPDIKLPSGLNYVNNVNSNFIYYKDKNFPEYNKRDNKFFCENKWYDWIITPNYHFGNQYEKDSGVYSSLDVKTCYKPCMKGYMPYITTNNEYKCVPKVIAEDGLFENKLDFSPVALINLIGNNKNTLVYLYSLSTTNSIIDRTNNNIGIDSNLYINNILDKILEKELNETHDKIKNSIKENILVDDIENIRNLKDIISYRNPLFNENDSDLITLRGMDTNNMLTDDILIHTYYLSSKIHEFITNVSINIENYTNENKKKEMLENQYNIINILKQKDINENWKHRRLANILYKAINICYNGKTDFSRNLIDYTQKALDILKSSIEKAGINNPFKRNVITEYISIPIINSIEIPYYKETSDIINIKSINDHLNTPEIKNNEATKNRIINFYTDQTNIIFYSIENFERVNKCNIGEVLDKDKRCVKCETICNNNENCTNIKNCSYFCSNTCKNVEKEEKSGTCGIKKKDEKKKELKKEDIETPIEKDFALPNFSTIIKVSIKIFLALIFIYIGYIFYQIYGETLLTIYNMIEYWIVYLSLYLYNLVFKFSERNVKTQKDFAEYILNNSKRKYEKVNTKINYS
jgi:hypothetical protein